MFPDTPETQWSSPLTVASIRPSDGQIIKGDSRALPRITQSLTIGACLSTIPTKKDLVFANEQAYQEWKDQSMGAGIHWRVVRSRLSYTRQLARSKASITSSSSAPSVARRRRYTYQWRESFKCDHGGRPSMRRGSTSMKIGCQAQFKGGQLVGREEIHVELIDTHTGHNPLSLESIRRSRLPKTVLDIIKLWIAEGMEWDTVKRKLQVDQTHLAALRLATTVAGQMLNGAVFPLALRVNYQTVYHIQRKRIALEAQCDPDGHQSLMDWAARLVHSGGLVQYTSRTAEEPLQFSFVTAWQRQLIHDLNPDVVCIDATHNTAFSITGRSDKVYLTTVVAKHLGACKGVPLGFLLCDVQSHEPLERFLNMLKINLQLSPSVVVIDCSSTEALAITKAWPNATIRYCCWHLYRAVRLWTRKNMKDVPKESRNEAYNDFYVLSQIPAHCYWDNIWLTFKRKWWIHHRPYLAYVTLQWYPLRGRWCRAYQPPYDLDITTNNYVEAYHSVLKTKYLYKSRVQRVDILVHILVDRYLPYLDASITRIMLGMEPRTLDKAEKDRKALAMAVQNPQDLVRAGGEEHRLLDVNTLEVRSFVQHSVWYTLQTSSASSAEPPLVNCSCPDHKKTRVVCKHMFLAARVTGKAIQFGPVIVQSYRATPSATIEEINDEMVPEDFCDLPQPTQQENLDIVQAEAIEKLTDVVALTQNLSSSQKADPDAFSALLITLEAAETLKNALRNLAVDPQKRQR